MAQAEYGWAAPGLTAPYTVMPSRMRVSRLGALKELSIRLNLGDFRSLCVHLYVPHTAGLGSEVKFLVFSVQDFE